MVVIFPSFRQMSLVVINFNDRQFSVDDASRYKKWRSTLMIYSSECKQVLHVPLVKL